MKVMVTGAFGNIGSKVVDALLENGHEVRCFDLKSSKSKSIAKAYTGLVDIFWGDICDFSCIERALVNVDAVVHMAAVIPPASAKNPDMAYAVNVEGTLNLLSALQQSQTCKRIVFASSSAVHGSDESRQTELKADTPYAPEDNYSIHKVEGEKAIIASGLKWTILRVAAVPPLNPANAQKGSSSVLFNVPVNSRIELLHEKDAGAAFANAIDCKEAINKIMMLGGGEKNGCRISGYDMVSMLMEASGVGRLPKEAFSSEHSQVHADWVDTDDSQRLLQFQKHTLQDMKSEVKKNMGVIYYLVRLFSPIVRYFLLKKSPYYKR